MAKRVCDPTSGSIGKETYLIGRNGQVVRTRAIPSNPKTAAQVAARADFKTASQGWDALTDDQRAAWRVFGSALKSKSRLGMSGSLTGNQAFVQVNAALEASGDEQVTDPPAAPAFTGTNVTALVITNTAGVISLKLSTTDSPPDGTELWGAGPVKAGVNRTPGMVLLGTLNSPVTGKVDISAQYAARFGSPPVGSRVFVAVREMENGLKGEELGFNATVPAGA